MNLANALLLPLFIHVLLITFVGIRTIMARINAVRSGEVKLAAIALNNAAWPDHVRKLGNNFDNQFDVPWLWYSACGFLILTQKVDVAVVAMSWGFLLTRLAHTYIHTGANAVRYRMYAYLSGFLLVFCMWAWFGFRLYVIG